MRAARQCGELPLTQGKVALIDEADYTFLKAFNWYATQCRGKWYAVRNGRKGEPRKIYLHGFLSGTLDGETDHRNGDTLDNRRQNLRSATHRRNMQNSRKRTTGRYAFKGICFHGNAAHSKRPWQARITIRGRRRSGGYFSTIEEAARAYDALARSHFGEFACPNYPEQNVEGTYKSHRS